MWPWTPRVDATIQVYKTAAINAREYLVVRPLPVLTTDFSKGGPWI